MEQSRKSESLLGAKSVAFCGLSIALLAVSAWVTVPFGPVPFTLQTFAVVFVVLALTPRDALVSLVGYVVLGGIGVPVFSGMRGGLGMLMGPTGGFLWGFVVGAVVALIVRFALDKTPLAWGNSVPGLKGSDAVRQLIAGIIIGLAVILICYLCGWIQLMAVAGYSPVQAFAVAIAPFIVIDIVKTIAAVFVAAAVKRALKAGI